MSVSMYQISVPVFIQMLGNLSGNIINYSDVARVLGVSQPTVREYFHIAHGTFIWRHIPPYEKNAAKRIVKHPKGYLRDSGILHFLLHLDNFDALSAHPQMGHSWESMVIENLLQGLNARGAAYDCYYYRTGAGAEIDLILEGELTFTYEGETTTLKAGDVIAIPSNAVHSAFTGNMPCKAVDAWSPVRKEFLEKL